MKLNIKKLQFIPNGMFQQINKLFAKDNEEKVELLYSYSAYETRKSCVNKEKTEEFKYPCVHATCVKEIKYWYSKTNRNGHFGIKKVIIGLGGAKNAFYDQNGDYGMTQDVFGIVVENDIEGYGVVNAFKNETFQEILKHITLTGFKLTKKHFYNFRKDFYKDFI